MHCADLVGGERLAEQVYRRHLATEHPLLVQLSGRTNVAFVEGLSKRKINVSLNFKQIIYQ